MHLAPLRWPPSLVTSRAYQVSHDSGIEICSLWERSDALHRVIRLRLRKPSIPQRRMFCMIAVCSEEMRQKKRKNTVYYVTTSTPFFFLTVLPRPFDRQANYRPFPSASRLLMDGYFRVVERECPNFVSCPSPIRSTALVEMYAGLNSILVFLPFLANFSYFFP